MKTFTITTTVTPTLALIAWLLVPQTAHCFYNASTGRWLSRDPIGERGGVNVYAFAPNDAVNDVDNLGLVKCACTLHPNASADKFKDPNDWGRTICSVSPPKVSVKECCSTGALWWKEYKYKLIVDAPASCNCDVYFLTGIDPDRKKGRSGLYRQAA